MYGAEIWGWKERGELEIIQKKYVKWSLDLDNCTPDYIVYRESGLDKIRITLSLSLSPLSLYPYLSFSHLYAHMHICMCIL